MVLCVGSDTQEKEQMQLDSNFYTQLVFLAQRVQMNGYKHEISLCYEYVSVTNPNLLCCKTLSDCHLIGSVMPSHGTLFTFSFAKLSLVRLH